LKQSRPEALADDSAAHQPDLEPANPEFNQAGDSRQQLLMPFWAIHDRRQFNSPKPLTILNLALQSFILFNIC
jgi:hypothetical protein